VSSGNFGSDLILAHGTKVIEFFGVISNRAVIEEEIKAILLVNPRPSSEEFTQYSFPSKNMEYMVSGTPLLTTKLPGMPEEYYDYVYLFEDESVEGMAKTLDRILKLPKEELHAKGAAAKEFVLREKNNVVQAKRIIEMIRDAVDKSCKNLK
ncbi:MAG: glycosyltransferase, partial [Candidatus Margulisiibacteriota bacterium]